MVYTLVISMTWVVPAITSLVDGSIPFSKIGMINVYLFNESRKHWDASAILIIKMHIDQLCNVEYNIKNYYYAIPEWLTWVDPVNYRGFSRS